MRQIGGSLDADRVLPVSDQEFSLAEARQAYALGIHGHPQGKIVVTVSRALWVCLAMRARDVDTLPQYE